MCLELTSMTAPESLFRSDHAAANSARNRNPCLLHVVQLSVLLAIAGLAGCTGTTSSQKSNPDPAVVTIAINPTSASLQTGGTQPFSAMVTGTSNTSVTWSASGGTISSSGMYTAGNAAGAYSVTATSVADSSKSAR